MRLTATLLLAASACSEPQPKGRPLPDPVTGTPVGATTGSTSSGSTSSGSTSGTPARGARITGIDPLNATTDCVLDPVLFPDPLNDFGQANWVFRTGGAIDSNVLQYFGPDLQPAEEFWGAEVNSALLPGLTPSVTYGVEVDGDGVLVGQGVPIAFDDALGPFGLVRGHYVVWVPWLFTFDLGAATDSGSGGSMVMYLLLRFGVDDAGNLVEIDYGGNDIQPPVFQIHLGDAGWNGDLAQTNAYCTMNYYLEGITLEPIF